MDLIPPSLVKAIMRQPLPQYRTAPAAAEFALFAQELTAYLLATEQGWLRASTTPTALQAERIEQHSVHSSNQSQLSSRQLIHLDLTPFQAVAQRADAADWFGSVQTFEQLISAYRQAKQVCQQEADQHVHPYAQQYLENLLQHAAQHCSAEQAQLIARWVSELDVYAAVKSVECLLDNPDNLLLFKVAASNGWRVLFDHLAIRCGSSQYQHAEQLVSGLQQQHGYVQSQLEQERFYQFDDGWNAYPLYKMLANGQVIRLFIDQSDAGNAQQIIQHWNYCYGFTAHHLALRMVHSNNRSKRYQAVPLIEVMTALAAAGLPALTATGFYTHGLLEQVFLKPHRNPSVPADIREKLSAIEPSLNNSIANGKLIELVSRRELPAELASHFLHLYGIENLQPPLSTPIYPYFLPAQAAHVIRTSLQTSPQEETPC